MKAIVYHEYGSADALQSEELPVPVAADDEVLVRVRAAGFNAMDRYFLKGTLALGRLTGRGANGRPGTDFAGEITAVGALVSAFKVGDTVFGSARGTLSEYITVKANRIALKPSTATFEQAGGLAMAGVTALQALRDTARVKAGQKVRIIGAAGGVGSFAVQIAKAFGATVTAVTSTGKRAAIAPLGAARVLDYTSKEFLDGTAQCDVIADCSGRQSLSDIRRALAPGGTYVAIGIDPNGLLRIIPRLVTMTIQSRLTPKKMRFARAKSAASDLVVLAELVDAGNLMSLVPRIFAFAEAAEAMRHFQSEGVVGKVVISVP
jgi:NADPH:quinone reductase-like Zn-dependent oxidoreductase